MLAKRKSDGRVIEVEEWRGSSDVIYSELDMNAFYQASDLDFSVNETKEAEGEVLSGWVAMDDDGWVEFHKAMPKPHLSEFCDTGDYITIWKSNGEAFPLGRMPIPNLTLDNSPMEVEITIKPKKK